MKPLGRHDPSSVGAYVLLGRLGSGGMGRVYLGRSPGGRQVAVKVVRPEIAEDPTFRTRFAREVEAARAVSGFYTAPVVDADPDAALPWLATAYVDGPDLRTAVEQHGPFPPDAVMMVAAGLAEALSAIHRVGLVHRDLKPSNVLLASDGPRVIDFGIARALTDTGLTREGVIGSVGFMSPEHLSGHPVGPPSDVFSLASTITFVATGEGPFGDSTPDALMYRVAHAEPRLGGVPASIRPLLARCLAKRASDRPTPEQIVAEIGREGSPADPAWFATVSQVTQPPDDGRGDTPVEPRSPVPPPIPPAQPGQRPPAVPVPAQQGPPQGQPQPVPPPPTRTSLMEVPAGLASPAEPASRDATAMVDRVPLGQQGLGQQGFAAPPQRRRRLGPLMIAFAFLGLLAIGAAFGVKYLQAQEGQGEGGGEAETDPAAFVAQVSPEGLKDDQFIREPVVGEDGQTAYAGADDNSVYAVDIANNKVRWRYQTKGRVLSTPFVDDGVVYAGDDAGFLHAIDAATGDLKWSDRVGDGGPVGSPAVEDGLVIVLTSNGKQVNAFSAEDGDEEWSERANASPYVRPMVFNDFVLVSSIRPAGVVVFQLDDGDFVGQFRTEDPIFATGVVADDWLFVASSNGAGTSAKLDNDTYHVYGFPLRRGTQEKPWRFRTSGPNPWPVAAVDGRVYVSSNDGNVYALDATKGTQKWAFSVPEKRFGGLAADEESVYVASDPGLVAINAATGKQRWINDQGGRPRTPTVADTVVVATTDQRLYAVNPVSGKR